MMHIFSDEMPIIACATSLEKNAAISVLRISGKLDLTLFQDFFSFSLKKIKERNATYTKLLYKKNIIDDVLLLYFKGPRSFTGEDSLEIHCHGNKILTNKVLSIFIESGLCRLAKNGEFTFRALRNKKLNLAQVEGLDLLLNANNSIALDQGINLLNGELFNSYQKIYLEFFKLRAVFDISIDFSEDVGQEELSKKIEMSLAELLKCSGELMQRAKSNMSSLVDPKITLYGPPNAGKSSIFNLLVGRSRAIVNSEKGTTRDYISESISIDENNYRLVDTAGIRESDNLIEKEGIKRS